MESNNGIEPTPICKIYILNDHRIFVEVLARYLTDFKHIEVVGTGIRGPRAYAEVARLQPPVIVVDPGPKLEDIVPTLMQLRQAAPATALIVLTQNYDAEYPALSLEAGAVVFIEKMAAVEDLVNAIVRHSPSVATSPTLQPPAAADGKVN